MAAVVVTCHPPLLGLLPRCLDSIESQTLPFDQKILVLDRVPMGYSPSSGWDVLHVDRGSGSLAMQDGMRYSNEEWTALFDSDNTMKPRYLEEMIPSVGEGVGFVYCHADFVINGAVQRTRWRPPFDEWGLGRWNYVDTSSLWRTSAALGMLRGEDLDPFLDYSLALDMVRAGYEGVLASPSSSLIVYHHSTRGMLNSRSVLQAVELQMGIRSPLFAFAVESESARRSLQGWLADAALPRRAKVVIADWNEIGGLLRKGWHEFVVTARLEGAFEWSPNWLLELYVPLFQGGFSPRYAACTCSGTGAAREVIGQPLLGGPWVEHTGLTSGGLTAWARHPLECSNLSAEVGPRWDEDLAREIVARGMGVVGSAPLIPRPLPV